MAGDSLMILIRMMRLPKLIVFPKPVVLPPKWWNHSATSLLLKPPQTQQLFVTRWCLGCLCRRLDTGRSKSRRLYQPCSKSFQGRPRPINQGVTLSLKAQDTEIPPHPLRGGPPEPSVCRHSLDQTVVPEASGGSTTGYSHSSFFIFWSNSVPVFSRSQRTRSLDCALALSVVFSSTSLYCPNLKVSLRKCACMAFVKASASWAPVCTHLSWMPSFNDSFIDLAMSWTLNSEHDGGAVRVIRSNNDLQSVIATSWFSCTVETEMAGSSRSRALSGSRHCTLGSRSHRQCSRIQAIWSKADAKEVVSADNVLVTTFWIFLLPQVKGLIGHWELLLISSWVPTIIEPAWESGFLVEAKDASEKAMNLKFWCGMGFMVIVTSWYRLASWSSRLADCNVSMLAWLISDWSSESLLERSGRVFVAAYWSEPIRPRRWPLSASVTGKLGCVLRWTSIGIDGIFRTYADWLKTMLMIIFLCEFNPGKGKGRWTFWTKSILLF